MLRIGGGIERYFGALQTYRTGDARPIVECFADACLYAASTGIELVDALDAQLTDARQKLDGLRKDSSAWRVLPQLIEQPIINTTGEKLPRENVHGR